VHTLDANRTIAERPLTVVLAAAGRQWDVKQLFTLSQVGLLRLNFSMQNLGIKLEFANIPFVAKPKPKRSTRGRAA